jgi:hypothetical protein
MRFYFRLLINFEFFDFLPNILTCRTMIRQAYKQFPKYGNQIRCQVPPCINDASLSDEEDLDKETKQLRLQKMVEVFNGVFTSRAGPNERPQKLDRKSGSTSQEIDDDEAEEEKPKKKTAKKKENSASNS